MSSDPERCYQAALRLLQYRWRSEKELDTRLRQKGFESEHIAAVITRLRSEKWLDDRRFAAEFASSQRSRHRGKHRIARELTARGINRDDAAEAVKRDDADERSELSAACQKRIRTMSRTRDLAFVRSDEGRRKLTAYLLRQGYDYQAVLGVIKEELGK